MLKVLRKMVLCGGSVDNDPPPPYELPKQTNKNKEMMLISDVVQCLCDSFNVDEVLHVPNGEEHAFIVREGNAIIIVQKKGERRLSNHPSLWPYPVIQQLGRAKFEQCVDIANNAEETLI